MCFNLLVQHRSWMQNSSGMLKGREVCSNAELQMEILFYMGILNHLNESLAGVRRILVAVTHLDATFGDLELWAKFYTWQVLPT